MVIASVTAIGGGTLCDVLMNRHAIFWVRDVVGLYVVLGATFATVLYVQVLPPSGQTLPVADALGLALFALTGGQMTEAARLSPLIVSLRDDFCATAAIGGIGLYLLLQAAGVRPFMAACSPWSG